MNRSELLAILLVVATTFGTAGSVFAYESLGGEPDGAHEILLVASHGKWSQSTVRVIEGERVRLRITSEDVLHGFALEGHDIVTTDIYAGKQFVAEFVAERPGTFVYRCLVWCDFDHPDMRGSLIVEPR
jgi:cytochrome c oxidase subunit 2